MAGSISRAGGGLRSTSGAFTDPTHRQRVRVFAQCKAEKKKIGPKYHQGDGGRSAPTPQRLKSEGRVVRIRITLHQRGSLADAIVDQSPSSSFTSRRKHEDENRINCLESRSLRRQRPAPRQGGGQVGALLLNRDKVGRPSLWVQNQRAPSWTPGAGLTCTWQTPPLYACRGTLTTHRVQTGTVALRTTPVFELGFWSTGCGRLSHVLQCDVNASTPSPRPR
jgi:hypothetical protein